MIRLKSNKSAQKIVTCSAYQLHSSEAFGRDSFANRREGYDDQNTLWRLSWIRSFSRPPFPLYWNLLKFRYSKILIGVTLGLISLQLYLGVLIGYLIGKIFAGKETGQPGIVKSIKIRIGSYRLHLHHWLVGLVVLLVTFFNNIFLVNPFLFYGALGGYIIQGIVCYSDWKKILIKQRQDGRGC